MLTAFSFAGTAFGSADSILSWSLSLASVLVGASVPPLAVVVSSWPESWASSSSASTEGASALVSSPDLMAGLLLASPAAVFFEGVLVEASVPALRGVLGVFGAALALALVPGQIGTEVVKTFFLRLAHAFDADLALAKWCLICELLEINLQQSEFSVERATNKSKIGFVVYGGNNALGDRVADLLQGDSA